MRQLGTLARRLDIHWTDAALALGLTAWTVVEGSGSDQLEGSPAVLLCTLPLLVRRRWPIPVLILAVIGFSIAQNATNLAALIGGVTAAVSVGLYTRQEILAWLAVAGSALVIALEFGHGPTSTLPIPGAALAFILLGASFLAGREISTRQQQLNQQRERAGKLEEEHAEAIKAAAEAERRHIARELHDVVAHTVSVMVVQAGAARQILMEKPEAARESLQNVENTGHEAMAELRRLLGVLGENGSQAPPLAPQPGLDGLEALAARVREAGLPVELRVEGPPLLLPPGMEVAAYRIVQEALTNALKYAGGAKTEVVVRNTPDELELEVVDEGLIVNPSDGIGRGLVGMQERIALFGGTVEAGKRPEGGYAVRARFPLKQPT
ncbi:MAG TPA: histidine kinase [Candidatus Dormibacteraeota bacterium]|nr:histidine kinase [Candidatus Dormibacteraeota bacterium]